MPTSNSGIGEVARACEPFMRQVFVTGQFPEEAKLKEQVNCILERRFRIESFDINKCSFYLVMY